MQSILSIALSAIIVSFASSLGLAQTLKVITPNGGETWEGGSTQTVAWQASGINDEVEVEFTTDGAQWRRIGRVSGSTTSISWTVDNRPSTTARVRVATKRGDASDQSDGTFTITPDPLDQVLLLSPNGGEILTEGQVHTIRWQLPVDAADAVLEYSTNFGVNWTPITTVAASLAQYPWTVPSVGKSDITSAIVRVSVLGTPDEFDISDAAFTIKPKAIITPASIAVTYPNGGETLAGGSQINVAWSYIASVGTGEGENEGGQFLVQYTTDNGITWKEIATEDAKTGAHSWTLPNVSTTTALVRVIQVGGVLADTSDKTFNINVTTSTDNSITLQSPNGGETWKEGEMHSILWSNTGELGAVKIFLETTDQQENKRKELLAEVTGSMGTLSWTIPNLGDVPLQARILLEAGGVEDASMLHSLSSRNNL